MTIRRLGFAAILAMSTSSFAFADLTQTQSEDANSFSSFVGTYKITGCECATYWRLRCEDKATTVVVSVDSKSNALNISFPNITFGVFQFTGGRVVLPGADYGYSQINFLHTNYSGAPADMPIVSETATAKSLGYTFPDTNWKTTTETPTQTLTDTFKMEHNNDTYSMTFINTVEKIPGWIAEAGTCGFALERQ